MGCASSRRRRRIEVMRNPESTKKMSTPIHPEPERDRWWRKTTKRATARRPSNCLIRCGGTADGWERSEIAEDEGMGVATAGRSEGGASEADSGVRDVAEDILEDINVCRTGGSEG